MLAEQGNACAICRTPFEKKGRSRGPCIDHNHATDEVRSLLCGHCNHVLGYAFESELVLKAAIEYLQRWARDGILSQLDPLKS
jgi:hypothetical protein